MKTAEENKKLLKSIIEHSTKITHDCQTLLDTSEITGAELDSYPLMLAVHRAVSYYEGLMYKTFLELLDINRYPEADYEFTMLSGDATILEQPVISNIISPNIWKVEINGIKYDAVMNDIETLKRLRQGTNKFQAGDVLHCEYKLAKNHPYVIIQYCSAVTERVKVKLSD